MISEEAKEDDEELRENYKKIQFTRDKTVPHEKEEETQGL